MSYYCFRFFNVLMAKEELAVEVAKVDGIKVNYVDLAKACQGEVLEEFAANATGTNKEDARLKY